MIYSELNELYNQWAEANYRAHEFHFAVVRRLGISRKTPIEEHLRHVCELHAESNQMFEKYKAAALTTYDYVGRCFQYNQQYIFVESVEVLDSDGSLWFGGPGFIVLEEPQAGSIVGFQVNNSYTIDFNLGEEDPGELMKELSRTEFQYKYKEMSELCWKQTLKDKIEK